MDRVARPALRGSRLGAILRLLNPVMRRLLRSPLHWPLSRWFAILTWTGRRSGQPYSTPISYVREDEIVWVTTGDRWWRNLLDGAPVGVHLAGRWREGTGAPVTDPTESYAVHARLFRAHPWFRLLSGIPADRTGDPDPTAIERAVDAGRVAVRIKLS
jgi:deazaflavin-dependent oxidoreductase (nitroreductase family)